METAHMHANFGHCFFGYPSYKSEHGCDYFSCVDNPFPKPAQLAIKQLLCEKRQLKDELEEME